MIRVLGYGVWILERHWGFDGGVGGVALDADILKAEVGDGFYLGVEPQVGQGAGLARELFLDLLKMVQIEVCVAQSVDKFSDSQIAYLRNNVR